MTKRDQQLIHNRDHNIGEIFSLKHLPHHLPSRYSLIYGGG